MSPYIVPDHVLERNLSTSLTPTFWGALTVVSFDSLDPDSPQLESSVIHEDPHPASAQLSASSKEPENTSTPLSKSIDVPTVRHRRLYFDDGSITLRVRLLHLDPGYCLNWRNLHRSRTLCIASIDLYSVADRRNSRISFRSFPLSKSPRTPLPFL
jgi:hypothetical protein